MNPGTNTSFDALKQVDAGHLNVGYAGLAEGEPHYDDLEARLAKLPAIAMPTITLEGDANGAPHPDPSAYAGKFSGKYAHRTISGGVGHNLPQEALAGLRSGDRRRRWLLTGEDHAASARARSPDMRPVLHRPPNQGAPHV